MPLTAVQGLAAALLAEEPEPGAAPAAAVVHKRLRSRLPMGHCSAYLHTIIQVRISSKQLQWLV